MKIAIHYNKYGFTPRWIAYCQEKHIPYKIVNAYDNDIVSQLADCDAFMWHYHQDNYRDMLFARQLLRSLQMCGMRVFPNEQTSWHFDDKIGQKYLLEAIGVPMVQSYVFYDKNIAIKWALQNKFPKVFKLRGGAGSSNVKLARNKRQALNFIHKAFHKGFPQFDKRNHLIDGFNKGKTLRKKLRGLGAGIYHFLISTEYSRMHGKEKGYAYFQDFIPNNTFDIRICIVGERAFGLKRMVRKNDFRASGSGRIIYSKSEIDERCVKTAFEVNDKLKMQSVAFDFIFTEKQIPQIVEISYGYDAKAYDACEGYWDKCMNWHPGSNFDFCGWMIEDLIKG